MVYLPLIVRREPAAPWFSDTAALNDGHPWAQRPAEYRGDADSSSSR
jgi:hypothetical protein